ncbi:hypothetical protein A3A67_05755 [Candidatus Peribacteria bacterium RIFCSPLOWO2_01_FULL_51_18]|nr:MAG: hypothetical protein A3A67_05755 [Candidatus Peribacteria bacterium RIFCSPLOWO2_01_FULL_51_18]OGJ68509.1 MAG: hypothetical protein A3J34_04395 [Candidatus Peribacteria bacterium RIFCSPLOWO2_02_FULL_51_10]
MPSEKKSRRFPLWFYLTLIAFFAGAFFLLVAIVFATKIFFKAAPIMAKNGGFINFITEKRELKGATEGRTNFLVLGLTLDEQRTDSILLLSYYHTEKKIAAVNIPRDLYTFDGFQHVKLASVFAFAKARQPNDPSYPPQFLADLLSREYRIPIHYWMTLNFLGAREIVDALGGVTVSVERPFTDYKYPKDDYSGYMDPAPHFDSGSQMMTGTSALIYMRSRHSQMSSEGSDFARSRRQQRLMQAVMKTAKEKGMIRNLLKIDRYLEILGKNVYTNMNLNEMFAAAMLLRNIDIGRDFHSMVWTTGSGFLCDGSASGSYIILYGTNDDCQAEAGSEAPSPYRDEAAEIISSLLRRTQTGSAKHY